MTLYRFVDSQKADGFPVAAACQAAGVSISAYYDWRRAQDSEPTPAQQAEDDLVAEISSVHEASGGTYGSPRVYARCASVAGWSTTSGSSDSYGVHDIVGVDPRKRVRTTIPSWHTEPAPCNRPTRAPCHRQRVITPHKDRNKPAPQKAANRAH